MVVSEEERTFALPLEDLLLLGSFLLLIFNVFLLVRILPLLLHFLRKMRMRRKNAGTKLIKRQRNPKVGVVSGKGANSAAVVGEEDLKDELSINFVLPPEILGHVLQNLHKKQDCQEASRVCSQWFLILAQLELRRRRLLGHCMHLGKRLRNCRNTTEVVCGNRKLVETLDQPSGIPVAARLLRLCKQHTKGLVIRDARRLTLVDYRLVGVFGNNLSDLTIQNCHSLDNKTLAGLLDGCTSIRSLHLTVTSSLDDEAAVGIANKCPRLEQLHLAGCYSLSPLGLVAVIHGCPGLQKLQLKAMGSKLDGPTKASFPIVPEGPNWNLRVLGLTSSNLVTDELLAAMAPRLRNLQQLDISNCPLVSDSGISMLIQECQGTLKDLKVKGSAVSDATLRKLAGSGTEVRLLSMAKCEGVTDSGIHALANAEKIPSLRHLCISACGVTDKGLEHLARKQKNMTRFKILDVQGCPDISKRGPMSTLGDQMVIIS